MTALAKSVKRDEFWARVSFVKRKRGGGGYVVRVGRKLGQLSFEWHVSRPMPVRAQAEVHARALLEAYSSGKPVQACVWWTWRVVERHVRVGDRTKTVYVGTVRKWVGPTSWVWREISPQDKRVDAERIAQQTVQAGMSLEAGAARWVVAAATVGQAFALEVQR